MAFYDYIILDGYRYKALAKNWKPMTIRPATVRLTLLGDMEGTFGSNALMKYEGFLSVVHGESAPGAADGTLYGNIYTLRETLTKKTSLTMTDHNGTAFSEVVLIGPFDEQMLTNIWNSADNKYFVRVEIMAKA